MSQSANATSDSPIQSGNDVGVFRYCGFMHVRALDDEHCVPLEEWLQSRFTEHWTARETADSGPHVQFYVEGAEWTKSDSNLFGKTGKYAKFLPEKMAKAKAKRWSKQVAKKDRDTNIAYVAKGGIMQLCSSGDASDYVGRWQYRKYGAGRETFQDKLMRLWLDGDKPQKHEDIYRLLVRSKSIPWNNCSGELLWKAADWLLSQCDNEEFESRMMAEYNRLHEKKYR